MSLTFHYVIIMKVIISYVNLVLIKCVLFLFFEDFPQGFEDFENPLTIVYVLEE